MDSCKVSKLIALACLATNTHAFASFSAPHYLGFSRDRSEFRLYLGAGEFLGRTGSLQAIRVTVHQLRKGQPLRALQGCVYYFDDMNRRRDRITCPQVTPGPLKGVEYAREPEERGKGAPGVDRMVCVRRCSGQVPQRLRLEEAEEDNG